MLQPNTILAMDKPERLMRRINAQNEMSQYIARAPKKTLVQEAYTVVTLMQALEDHDSDVENTGDNEFIDGKAEVIESHYGRAQTTENQDQEYFTCVRL